MIKVLDLHFKDLNDTIASFLVETSEGPVLIESGPHSTFDSLKSELKKHGFLPKDIKHLLLTHIHFDHAGAAWALAKNGTRIHVHPFGAKHMQDPTKLYNSAKMIYQDQMEVLWGEMQGIDETLINIPEDNKPVIIGDKTFKPLFTPGHAKHHIAWQLNDIIFTGDVAGVKIENGPVVPPCPPPDINLEDWNESIDILLNATGSQLYLTHFGLIVDKVTHLQELRTILNDWAEWIKTKWMDGLSADEITPLFQAYTANQLREKGVSEAGILQYEAANPSWMSVGGLIRYWKKKEA